MSKSKYPNCTYSAEGCMRSGECARCGFDKDEAERRKKLPLALDRRTGKRRKFTEIRRQTGTE